MDPILSNDSLLYGISVMDKKNGRNGEKEEEEEKQRGEKGCTQVRGTRVRIGSRQKRSPSVYWVSSLPDSLEVRGEGFSGSEGYRKFDDHHSRTR